MDLTAFNTIKGFAQAACRFAADKNFVKTASADMSHNAVSYTHLDVYKRQL